MWFLRRMLRILWTEKKTNEMVLKEAETNISLVQKIRKQQATFLGSSRPRHLERHDRQRYEAGHLMDGLLGQQFKDHFGSCTGTDMLSPIDLDCSWD